MREIQNCPVAVVGGAGFLGSHLVDYLIEEKSCQVLVIDNLVVGRREFVHPAAEFLHHDITGSEDYLREVFRRFGVKYCFNYSAWPYIPDSFARPLHVFNVNATAAIKVINAAQEAGAEGILQVSSAEIYGEVGAETRDRLITEDDLVRPHSTYGAAKAAVDYYCQSAWKERQTPVIALRQFNCAGERESHPYVIPEIIGQLNRAFPSWRDVAANRPATVTVELGNDSYRDFQYAGDAVRMATELLERGQFGAVYNMGSEDGIKIYDLAKLLGRIMGFPSVEVKQDPARVRPWEIWHLRASNEKLYGVIKARPTVDLEEALRRTVDWYRAYGCRWPWERRESFEVESV